MQVGKHTVPQTSQVAGSSVSKYQRFEPRRICRNEIKNCPYNPRVISAQARKDLKASLDVDKGGDGLLGPVYVNSTTMNCYGGNQRLAILDALEQRGDYLLDVAMAKLTPKKEQAACVRINNLKLQGDWDLALLAELMPQLNLENTGFGAMDMEIMLGEKGAGIFGAAEQSAETQAAVGDMAAMQKAREDEVEAAKGRRQKIRETTKAEHTAEDTERIAYVVFPDRKAREDWVESLGLGRGERYVPCKLVGVRDDKCPKCGLLTIGDARGALCAACASQSSKAPAAGKTRRTRA